MPEEKVTVKRQKVKACDVINAPDATLVFKNQILTMELQAAMRMLKKYSRAIKILQDKKIIMLGKNGWKCKYYLQRNDTNGNVQTIELTKEEYELMEEVLGWQDV